MSIQHNGNTPYRSVNSDLKPVTNNIASSDRNECSIILLKIIHQPLEYITVGKCRYRSDTDTLLRGWIRPQFKLLRQAISTTSINGFCLSDCLQWNWSLSPVITAESSLLKDRDWQLFNSALIHLYEWYVLLLSCPCWHVCFNLTYYFFPSVDRSLELTLRANFSFNESDFYFVLKHQRYT